MALTYNTATKNLSLIYRATSGGTVFSANLVNETDFDYFEDAPSVNDCLYFCINTTSPKKSFSDLIFTVGTPMAGTDIVLKWEYYNGSAWIDIPSSQDDTSGLTVAGTFHFGLPWQWSSVTINGTSQPWIRCRLVSFSTVTEGGANTTTKVTAHDGRVNIVGYTDASPCTFTDIYNYLVANAPWLNIVKNGSYFDFREVDFNCASRLISIDEIIEHGISGGSHGSGDSNFNYLQMGLLNPDGISGRKGSVLIENGVPNSYGFQFDTNTKFYGSTIKSARGAGYPALKGEWIDSNLDGINFSPSPSGIVKYCRIVDPGVWIGSAGLNTVFENNKVIVNGSNFIYTYYADLTIPNLDYAFVATTNSYLLYLYATLGVNNFTFIDPLTPLPSVYTDTTNTIVGYSINTPTVGYSKVWFYDASADTYTDVTTLFSDATVDNAPIDGDEGDCYYFGHSSTFNNPHWLVKTNLTSNDYEYSFDFYHSGWKALSPVWDRTNNFTVDNERIYFGKDGLVGSYTGTAFTINGHSAY